jgi:hypothetical protein
MTRGPVVEQRPGRAGSRRDDIPLWIWPLALILLGALALGMSLSAGDEQAGPVTDMLVVANDSDQEEYAGQQASFANVMVQSVAGDRGFWIGPDAEQQLFVVIDEANAGRSENSVQIAPGQMLTLNGVLEELPPLDQIPPEWGLDAPNSAALDGEEIYLHATQVLGP